jgi:hypothetical protein
MGQKVLRPFEWRGRALVIFGAGLFPFPLAANEIALSCGADIGATPVDANIARLNIEFFRRRLGAETDQAKRAMIERLLAEEIAKLEGLSEPPLGQRGRKGGD